MNFTHSKNIVPGGDQIAKICGASWSPNNMRLAIAGANRKIMLFDENGTKKDVFSTKARDKTKEYVIRDIVFSPDSTKLAVAQSDNIIFVYKLGTRWGDTKSICNKLEQSSSVMCLVWSRTKAHEIFFGLEEGKVKIGLLGSKNSSSVLYSYEFPLFYQFHLHKLTAYKIVHSQVIFLLIIILINSMIKMVCVKLLRYQKSENHKQ